VKIKQTIKFAALLEIRNAQTNETFYWLCDGCNLLAFRCSAAKFIKKRAETQLKEGQWLDETKMGVAICRNHTTGKNLRLIPQ